MDMKFWHQKWEEDNISFHQGEINPLLLKHFNTLSLAKGSRVFLPLCGKTLDIAWLLAEGYRVVGAELSEIAIEQLFAELKIKPTISNIGAIKHYSAKHIEIFVGDLFNVSSAMLASVDAVYDRAALVALPTDIRTLYTAHLKSLSNTAPQLLICYEYDQHLMAGPPFSISSEEVKQHYNDSYKLTLIASIEVPGGVKEQCPAKENIWLLQRK